MEAPPDLSAFKPALIILAAAAIVIPLFHRLRLSPVLGFMLVGVAVGPFGLAALADRCRCSARSPSTIRRRSRRSPNSASAC